MVEIVGPHSYILIAQCSYCKKFYGVKPSITFVDAYTHGICRYCFINVLGYEWDASQDEYNQEEQRP